RGRHPIELERRTTNGTIARAGRGVLDERGSGHAGPGSTVFTDHLRHVVDGSEVASLALLQIAVQPCRQLEAPPLLYGIGDLYGHSLFDAGNVERSALQNDLYASCARVERACGMALCAGSRVVSGGARNARCGTVTMTKRCDWRNAR